jgi:hypothetical protein
MLLFLVVSDGLIAAICLVCAWNFDGVDEWLEFDATAVARVFATQITKDAQLQSVPDLTELFHAHRT